MCTKIRLSETNKQSGMDLLCLSKGQLGLLNRRLFFLLALSGLMQTASTSTANLFRCLCLLT